MQVKKLKTEDKDGQEHEYTVYFFDKDVYMDILMEMILLQALQQNIRLTEDESLFLDNELREVLRRKERYENPH